MCVCVCWEKACGRGRRRGGVIREGKESCWTWKIQKKTKIIIEMSRKYGKLLKSTTTLKNDVNRGYWIISNNYKIWNRTSAWKIEQVRKLTTMKIFTIAVDGLVKSSRADSFDVLNIFLMEFLYVRWRHWCRPATSFEDECQ